MFIVWSVYNTFNTWYTRTPICKILYDSSTDVVFFTGKPILFDHLRVVIIAHTSIMHIQSNLPMQSPLLSSQLYWKVTFFLSCIDIFIWIEPLLTGHLSYKATVSVSQWWPLNTGLTVYSNELINGDGIARLGCGRKWIRSPVRSNQRVFNWHLLLLC